MKTNFLCRFSLGVLTGWVAVVGLAVPENVRADEDQPPSITVLVNNYSKASPPVVAAAEHEAARILSQAGLRVSWLNCPVRPSTLGPDGRCQEAPEGTDIRLRVVPEPIRMEPQNWALGFAVQPVLATVYYEHALRRARSDDAKFELPIILGCVIAHELGHLLLGSNSHSDRGIMLPRWEVKQVRQLMMGVLLFTPQQSKQIRREARARSERRKLMSLSSTP